MIWHGPEIALKITAILDVSDKAVKVVSKTTGKPVWLSRQFDFFPGCVFIPVSLAKKIGAYNERDNYDD